MNKDYPYRIINLPQPDPQTQSYILKHLAEILGQPATENLTDLCAVSAPNHCLGCPCRKSRPNCNQCNRYL